MWVFYTALFPTSPLTRCNTSVREKSLVSHATQRALRVAKSRAGDY